MHTLISNNKATYTEINRLGSLLRRIPCRSRRMAHNQRRANGTMMCFLFFTRLKHFFSLNYYQSLHLCKTIYYKILPNRHIRATTMQMNHLLTCWSIPLTVGVFHRMTVRWHFPKRNASKVRLWSLRVPGIPLTKVMYRFGLHAIGTTALYAL